MMTALEKSFGVDRRTLVAISPWSNGTCEQVMREVVRTLMVMIYEERRTAQRWVVSTGGSVCLEHYALRKVRLRALQTARLKFTYTEKNIFRISEEKNRVIKISNDTLRCHSLHGS